MSGNYEVYANGLRIGGSGKMTERLLSAQESLVTYAVPGNLTGERGDLVLAIRCMVNWGSSRGRGASTPLRSQSIYLLGQEAAPLIASYAAAHMGGPELLLGILALLAGVISFALYFALCSQREYLAIGIYLLADSVMMALQLWLYIGSFSYPIHVLDFVVLSVLTIALIEFVRLVLHLPRTRWLLALEVVCSLVFLVTPLNTLGIMSNTLNAVFFVPVLVMKIVLPVLLLRGRLRGNREAGLLLPAILIGSLADYWYFLRNVAYYAHLNALLPYFPFEVSLGSYQVDFYASAILSLTSPSCSSWCSAPSASRASATMPPPNWRPPAPRSSFCSPAAHSPPPASTSRPSTIRPARSAATSSRSPRCPAAA